MKYGLGDMVAFGYKVGMITDYLSREDKYQVEWLGGENRLEIMPANRIGELRENFKTLRNLIILSGYGNGI